MPKETYYPLAQIKKNLTTFNKKLKDKNQDYIEIIDLRNSPMISLE